MALIRIAAAAQFSTNLEYQTIVQILNVDEEWSEVGDL